MKYMDPPLPGPNPCLVDKMPEERQPRYVPPEEDFWKVFEIAGGQDKVMLLAFLHSAARRGEIFRLDWSVSERHWKIYRVRKARYWSLGQRYKNMLCRIFQNKKAVCGAVNSTSGYYDET
jgi:hypothetical protein